jgi:putative membrane protein
MSEGDVASRKSAGPGCKIPTSADPTRAVLPYLSVDVRRHSDLVNDRVGEEHPMMYWWGGPMNGWGLVLMSFGSVALWALVILGFVLLVRALRGGRAGDPGRGAGAAPDQLLAQRYARGEIDDEEYRHRLDTLAGRFAAKPRP